MYDIELIKAMKKKIVLIGGGVGASTFTRALKSLPLHLSTIVSTFDDGGSTGAIRRDYRGIALGDFRQCLFASVDLDESVKKVLDYRFGRGNLYGVNVGNLLLKAFLQSAKTQRHGVLQFHKLLKMENAVIPVSYDYSRLCARLTNNRVLTDQAQIQAYYSFSQAAIKSLYLSNTARLSPEGKSAMKNTDYLVFAPGNFFSSILPNLHVKGFAEEWKKSTAKKIFFFNLLAHRGQDSYYTLMNYLAWFQQRLGKKPFDIIVVNKKIANNIVRKVEDRFELTKITEEDKKSLKELGIEMHIADLVSPVIRAQPKNDTVLRAPLRHDTEKIQHFFKHILSVS